MWNQSGRLSNTEPLWREIRAYLSKQKIDYQKTKIYQDGHGIEMEEIYGDGIEAVDVMSEGPNKDFIGDLIKKGAKIKGTENSVVLDDVLFQRQILIEAILERDLEKAIGHLAQIDALTPLRDRAIAHRIRTTLGPKETGVLFLGAGHRIKDYVKGLNLISPPHIFAIARQLNPRD